MLTCIDSNSLQISESKAAVLVYSPRAEGVARPKKYFETISVK